MSSGYAKVEKALQLLRQKSRATNEGFLDRVLIGPSGRAQDAALARDHIGQIHLITRLPTGRTEFDVPLGRTLRAEWISLNPPSRETTHLDITCTDHRLQSTFLSLVGEMLNRAQQSGRFCIDELNQVLGDWRTALSREQLRLTRNQAMGLFGELLVLEQLAQLDPHVALKSWRGPRGDRHDFILNNSLEVKTISGTDAPKITIHGLRQLDPFPGAKLHLITYRIIESAEGRSVAQTVDELVSIGIPKQQLVEAAQDKQDLLEDTTYKFVVEEMFLHCVGDNFPGIRATRLDEVALTGVEAVTYDIQLDACPGKLPTTLLNKVLKEL